MYWYYVFLRINVFLSMAIYRRNIQDGYVCATTYNFIVYIWMYTNDCKHNARNE